VLPGVGVRAVGESGIVIGVTLFETTEVAPVPTTFIAFTVKVYAVPFVKPVTVIGEPLPVPVKLPGLEVTV
jgi:hypothetical protein